MPFAALILAALTLPAAHAQSWPDVSRPPLVYTDGGKDAALVIAIEDYAFAQDIPGAAQNGKDWVTWLSQGRGVPLVKSLFNHTASKEDILAEAVKVAALVQPGGRLWLVYIGHGAPSESGDDGLLVGVDARQTPQSLSARGLPRAQLLQAVEKVLPAGVEVVLVQDACFSGKTSRGDLAPGMAPLKVVSAALGAKVTVLSGARSDEYAGPLPDGTRPAFSYLVLGALRGWGDFDANGVVTAEEAVGYANRALVQTVTGRSQKAELAGADLPLGRSGRERGPDLTALSMVASGAVSGAALGPGTLGQVRVDLGGQATDFAALAAAAAAADGAAQQSAAQKAAAEAALAKERRRRLDAAAAEVRAAATRDYAAIAPLVVAPTANGKRVLEAWLARYGEAKVTIDGVVEPVAVAEVARVRAALDPNPVLSEVERLAVQRYIDALADDGVATVEEYGEGFEAGAAAYKKAANLGLYTRAQAPYFNNEFLKRLGSVAQLKAEEGETRQQFLEREERTPAEIEREQARLFLESEARAKGLIFLDPRDYPDKPRWWLDTVPRAMRIVREEGVDALLAPVTTERGDQRQRRPGFTQDPAEYGRTLALTTDITGTEARALAQDKFKNDERADAALDYFFATRDAQNRRATMTQAQINQEAVQAKQSPALPAPAAPTPAPTPLASVAPQTTEADPASLIELAEGHLAAGRAGAAEAVLDRFLSLYPKHERTPEAMYRRAEAAFNAKSYPQALLRFQEVIDQHKKSPWASWAMLRQGDCWDAQGQKENARLFYGDVVRLYPKTKAAEDALQRLAR